MSTVISDRPAVKHSSGGVGRVARVIGPVVDVEFPVDNMPEIYNLLETEFELSGENRMLSLEVAQHIGDGMVRAISLQPTDGLVRGASVQDTGGPITVPVKPSCRRTCMPALRTHSRLVASPSRPPLGAMGE